jgi:hypothetical protein
LKCDTKGGLRERAKGVNCGEMFLASNEPLSAV